MLTTITNIKKLVPQRGCNVDFLRAFSTVVLPGPHGEYLVLSAMVLEDSTDIFQVLIAGYSRKHHRMVPSTILKQTSCGRR
jgi:hypothetical protein